jgi:hypothetical protein
MQPGRWQAYRMAVEIGHGAGWNVPHHDGPSSIASNHKVGLGMPR